MSMEHPAMGFGTQEIQMIAQLVTEILIGLGVLMTKKAPWEDVYILETI